MGNPDALWLIWLVPGLWLLLFLGDRRGSRLLQRFAGSAQLRRLVPDLSRGRRRLRVVLLLLGLLAAILSLARFRQGFTWQDLPMRGVDIVIALDVSDSMLAEDAAPGGRLSRLERSHREIADLLGLLAGDRVALVAFAGTAFVECPLTSDYDAARHFLEIMDTRLIPIKGSDLGAAIDLSIEAFASSSQASRAILVISDGEDHGGEGVEAARRAARAGARVFAIGVGRPDGAPIPTPEGGFRRDRRGEIVLSRLQEQVLQRVAREGGGRYVRSVTGDQDLEQIYGQGIRASLEASDLGTARRKRWNERFQWFLALSLGALMVESLISDRRAPGPTAPAGVNARPGRRQGAAVALLLAILFQPAAGAAQARAATDPFEAYRAGSWEEALEGFLNLQVERPEDPAVAVDVGSSFYRLEDYPRAAQEFGRATGAEKPEIRGQALYNLGNTAYRQGRLQEAAALWEQTLEVDPEDEDARFNLEFVRREIERREQEAQKREQSRGGTDGEERQSGSGEEPEEGGGTPADSDRDGLPDQLEREADNPTDPRNPDSDGDGLSDGEEDRNRNGRLDPGETDPNRPDSGADGAPSPPSAGAGEGGHKGEDEAAAAALSREEAERYLEALEEGRPRPQHPPLRSAPPEKDW